MGYLGMKIAPREELLAWAENALKDEAIVAAKRLSC